MCYWYMPVVLLRILSSGASSWLLVECEVSLLVVLMMVMASVAMSGLVALWFLPDSEQSALLLVCMKLLGSNRPCGLVVFRGAI